MAEPLISSKRSFRVRNSTPNGRPKTFDDLLNDSEFKESWRGLISWKIPEDILRQVRGTLSWLLDPARFDVPWAHGQIKLRARDVKRLRERLLEEVARLIGSVNVHHNEALATPKLPLYCALPDILRAYRKDLERLDKKCISRDPSPEPATTAAVYICFLLEAATGYPRYREVSALVSAVPGHTLTDEAVRKAYRDTYPSSHAHGGAKAGPQSDQ